MKPLVSVVMGSASDLSVMKSSGEALRRFGIEFEVAVISAHRTPQRMVDFAREASGRGIRVIIAGAGGAAHLPGMIASLTELPVIGVPVPVGPLQGEDSLLSIVQMPKGVPVATVAIGNAWNAGVLAAQILATGGAASDIRVREALRSYKRELEEMVNQMKIDTSTF